MQKKAATVRAPSSFEQYLADIRDRTTALERFTDRATSLDERIDVSNLLLIEILRTLAKEIEIHLPEYPKEGAAETTGYVIKSYPMDTARVSPGEEIRIQGDTIIAYTDDLAGCFIRVNSPVGDPIPLSAFNPYTHPGSFNSLWLETPAQPGMTITLLIGRAGAQAMAQTVRTIITAALATVNVDVVAQTIGNMNVDVVAQSVGNIGVDIVAQTVGNIGVDIVAQTVGNIGIDIVAQTIGNLDINIAAQVANLNVNIAAQTANINVSIAASTITMNVNISSQSANIDIRIAATAVTLNVSVTNASIAITGSVSITGVTDIDITAQSVAVYNAGEWQAKANRICDSWGGNANLAVDGSVNSDVTVPAGRAYYITNWSARVHPRDAVDYGTEQLCFEARIFNETLGTPQFEMGGYGGNTTAFAVPFKIDAGRKIRMTLTNRSSIPVYGRHCFIGYDLPE